MIRGLQRTGGAEYASRFFFQAEGGIRGLVRSRGLGDVYKKQHQARYGRFKRLVDVGAGLAGLGVLLVLVPVVVVGLSLIHI